MRVYVLGAGASVHAGYPLAAHLGTSFASWVGTLPPAHRYHERIKQLRTIYGTLDDFESVMTDLFVCAPGSRASTLPKGVRPYLIGDIEEGITEYFNAIRHRAALLCDLLAHRTRRGDVVLTFNYELSVERSLQAAGLWQINDGYGFQLTPEGGTSPVRVLKLHGSTNWRGLLFGGGTGFAVAQNSLGERPVMCFRPDFENLGFPDVVDPLYGQLPSAATITAMIMPVLKKTFFQDTTFGNEWQPFWDLLWDQAAKALQEADEIFLIGYSMPAADEPARALLLENLNKRGRVTISAQSATPRIAGEFRKSGYTHVIEPPNPTFAAWIAPPMQPEAVQAEARPVIVELQRHRSNAAQILKQVSWFRSSLGFSERRISARERARMQKQLAQVIDRLVPYNVGLGALSGQLSIPAAIHVLLDGLFRTMLEAVNQPVAATEDAVDVFQ